MGGIAGYMKAIRKVGTEQPIERKMGLFTNPDGSYPDQSMSNPLQNISNPIQQQLIALNICFQLRLYFFMMQL